MYKVCALARIGLNLIYPIFAPRGRAHAPEKSENPAISEYQASRLFKGMFLVETQHHVRNTERPTLRRTSEVAKC